LGVAPAICHCSGQPRPPELVVEIVAPVPPPRFWMLAWAALAHQMQPATFIAAMAMPPLALVAFWKVIAVSTRPACADRSMRRSVSERLEPVKPESAFAVPGKVPPNQSPPLTVATRGAPDWNANTTSNEPPPLLIWNSSAASEVP